MKKIIEPKLITKNEFVTHILIALKEKEIKTIELDGFFQKIENVFKDFVQIEKDLNVLTNFSFYLNKTHGDNLELDEALLNLNKKKFIVSYPLFNNFEISISSRREQAFLKRYIPKINDFFKQSVQKYF